VYIGRRSNGNKPLAIFDNKYIKIFFIFSKFFNHISQSKITLFVAFKNNHLRIKN